MLAQCKLTFSRASGPGGQNRNKVETSVQIEYLPASIIAAASECRTQNDNRKVAVQRLRCKLAIELRTTPVTETNDSSSGAPANEQVGSKTWREYCRNGRVDIAESNSDWPTILAEIIGILSECDWSTGRAATILGTTSSQLVKLLKKAPPAFELLNRERKARGQRPLE
ncbi:MAG TPA: peptide chain release factor-like protein [Pirellula sp.]|nr:peptide chain release factor-like protein [Pirellula sp.]